MEKIEVVCRGEDYLVGRVHKARINQEVLDEKRRIMGRVVSVFGPVSRPYIKVRIQRRGGRELYLGGEKKWRKKKRRRSG